ncbi:peptidoglycan-binding domain-containing protein [Hansschlegelia zhihuaiae]|uniref:peptidoglycan-binding domain-containing protein n=1 Tax=Hansschlegelia zhihuaiae TaxID=405005 RepID=UPI0013E8B969|nr:peptidoglycan-binding domain-containing protein [Hansschlegelia zhihuaiae]
MPRSAPRDYGYDGEPRGLIGSALAVAARRPVDALAGALAAACAVMILVNALLLQQGRPAAVAPSRHAAEATASAPRVAPKRDDLVAQVQTALAERELYDGVVDGVMGSATSAAVRAFEQAQGMTVTGEASEKTLAALMTAPVRPAGAPAKPAAKAPAQAQSAQTTGSTAAPANAKMIATQRALARIGYGPVTIDGKMGAETRNAIKSFERDRGMPETGEPSPAVLRALQAMTGAPLQ